MQTRTVEYKGVQTDVNVGNQTAMVLDALNASARGRIGYIENHVSGKPGEKGCIRPSVSNMWFITKPRYDRYLARKREAVEKIELSDVSDFLDNEQWNDLCEKCEKCESTKTDIISLFNLAKTEILNSVSASESGDKSDGQRQGHENCYAHFDDVTLHLLTVEDEDGHMTPVIAENGLMTAVGCMLPFYTMKRKYSDHGEWKPVNSRPLTLMKNAIVETTHLHEWKAFNLGKMNFTYITFDSNVILGHVRDSETALFDSMLSNYVKDIGGLDLDPMEYLQTQRQTVKA